MISLTVYSGEPPARGNTPEASTHYKRTLVEKALALKAGDSYQTVTNRLGVPTNDTKHQNKNGEWIGRSLKYFFDSKGVDEGDADGPFAESVLVFLDGQGRVRHVTLKVTLGDGNSP